MIGPEDLEDLIYESMNREAVLTKVLKEIPAKYREPTRSLDQQLIEANQILAYQELKIRSLLYDEVKRTGIFNKHLEIARQQLARIWRKYEDKCEELREEREKTSSSEQADTGPKSIEGAEQAKERHSIEKVRHLLKAAQTYLEATCGTAYKRFIRGEATATAHTKQQPLEGIEGYTLLDTIQTESEESGGEDSTATGPESRPEISADFLLSTARERREQCYMRQLPTSSRLVDDASWNRKVPHTVPYTISF